MEIDQDEHKNAPTCPTMSLSKKISMEAWIPACQYRSDSKMMIPILHPLLQL